MTDFENKVTKCVEKEVALLRKVVKSTKVKRFIKIYSIARKKKYASATI